MKKIGKGAFYNCTALESVTAPGVVEIGDEAFYGCGSMMKTDILSSVEVIGNSAFYGCSGLTEVVLPETLSSMGESCFENCTMFKKGGAGRNASGNQPVLFLWLSYTDGCRIPGFHDKEWNTAGNWRACFRYVHKP